MTQILSTSSKDQEDESSPGANAESAALHQSIHHPSIVSLFSVFSIPSATYHVLELCPQGTLSDYLSQHSNSHRLPVLSDNQLRGVLKSVADALAYLRKELVLHRNLNPTNLLITNEYRIKLGDFSLAIRLPTVNSTSSILCGAPNYVSPEMIARIPYSFPTDLWSLGCVLIACLNGIPPFEASSIAATHERISRGKYELPTDTSLHTKDLISRLLRTDPRRRIDIDDVLSHPFLDPS
ncbi:kinase-like protein, partial [Gloeophyllum trabeum ATCC 11539]